MTAVHDRGDGGLDTAPFDDLPLGEATPTLPRFGVDPSYQSCRGVDSRSKGKHTMEKKYLMANANGLTRTRSGVHTPTRISSALERNLLRRAMNHAFEFYGEFFGTPIAEPERDALATEYERSLSDARSLRLFSSGGVGEKDHLNLWCLGHVLRPLLYVESGVFIGSSLHAFKDVPGIERIVAIDPLLSNLKLARESLPQARFVDDQDFSQIELPGDNSSALAYFDDHIDTAARIVQAHEKGIRRLLFDDSTGLEGICQRLYPAIPTVPMIMNFELMSPGDQVSWTFRPAAARPAGLLRRFRARFEKPRYRRVDLTITDELIARCKEARALIKRCARIPDLGEFIAQGDPGPMPDTSKYLMCSGTC